MEKLPLQKEFGEIHGDGNFFQIWPFGKSTDTPPAGELVYAREFEPFEHYDLSGIRVEPEYHGKGFGAQLKESFEKLCLHDKMPAVLYKSMDLPPDSPSRDIYEKRGWKVIK